MVSQRDPACQPNVLFQKYTTNTALIVISLLPLKVLQAKLFIWSCEISDSVPALKLALLNYKNISVVTKNLIRHTARILIVIVLLGKGGPLWIASFMAQDGRPEHGTHLCF